MLRYIGLNEGRAQCPKKQADNRRAGLSLRSLILQNHSRCTLEKISKVLGYDCEASLTGKVFGVVSRYLGSNSSYNSLCVSLTPKTIAKLMTAYHLLVPYSEL